MSKYLYGSCTESECTLCRTHPDHRRKGMHHSGISSYKEEDEMTPEEILKLPTPETDKAISYYVKFPGHFALHELFVEAKSLERRLAAAMMALHSISLGSNNSGTSKEDLGKEAREAIAAIKEAK